MIAGAIFLILPARTLAGKNPEEVKIPPIITPGLHHFLDLVDPDKNVSFNPGLVAKVMAFIGSPKDEVLLQMKEGGTGPLNVVGGKGNIS